MSLRIKSKLIAMPKPLLGMVAALGLLFIVALGGGLGFVCFVKYSPPPLAMLDRLSVEVVDRDKALLRAYTTEAGRWRLAAHLDSIDDEFINILLAYEDKRFWQHGGIDAKAMVRAFWQLLSNGRIISGASTITMQLARLIEPRDKRTFAAKLLQMARALQLEARFSKREILTAYLTLAPYGGNLEGIRAASLAYFAKEPGDLTLSEAALLVALPQSPEARRPDLRPERALSARNNVLMRMANAGVIAKSEVARAASRPVSSLRHPMPQLAAHAADRLRKETPKARLHETTMLRAIQERMETVVKEATERLSPDLSIALVLADAKNGTILAEIGSPDYLSEARKGWVDMSRALRSPGSALKPFIYGLAFEEGLVRAETLITDRPINFGGYRPKNFDMDYQGEVSVRNALLLSLNVPAVALLDSVGPARLMERLERGGVTTQLPDDGDVGLAIGLGGLGISLKDLTQLYTSFVNGGRVVPLVDTVGIKDTKNKGGTARRPERRAPVLSDNAAWHIADILIAATPPEGASNLAIAYKTGTSYGYRDAWSVGFDGRHVLGVWVGKPDNSAVPGITGRTAAAPILFEAFAKSGLDIMPLSQPPLGTERQTLAELPPTMQRFKIEANWFQDPNLPEPAPKISYPPSGAQIEMGQTSQGQKLPVMLKLQDGRPPFRWLANGRVFETNANRRRVSWNPDGAGQSTLTVIDAAGRADSVSVFLRQP
ncbi:penicillin-binding protein 1C [Cohaesibacter celericrescens]|nr:penicillin-binding protein 1C [Cohaesibacter celericrescens]